MFIILYVLKVDIFVNNVICIKSEIKKFEIYLDDFVLLMVNYFWLVYNINIV